MNSVRIIMENNTVLGYAMTTKWKIPRNVPADVTGYALLKSASL